MKEKEIETDRHLPFADLLLNVLQQPRLGLVKAKSPEPNPGFHYEWQRPNCMHPHLTLLRVCISRKLGWKQSSQDSNQALLYRGHVSQVAT